MKHLISTKQLMFSAAAFIIASSLLTRYIYKYTKNETWIPILLGFVISFAIIIIYGRLARNHPGLTLIEINTAVFGGVIGKIITACYIFYFFSLLVLNARDLNTFIAGYLLPNTPVTIIYVAFLFICSYAARKGAVAMTRYAALITIVYITAIIVNTFLVINKMHLEYLPPVFNEPIKNYFFGTHIAVMMPFCEIIVFMMFTPYMQKPAEIGKALKGGLIIAFAVLLLITVRDIVVLGDFALRSTMPTYSTIRLIDVGDILTRLEIVFAVLIMTMLFFKISVLLFSTVKGFGQLFKIENYRIFIYIIVTLSIIYANGMFLSSYEQTEWISSAATYATFFLLVLPVITLIVSEIRKSAKRGATAESPQP